MDAASLDPLVDALVAAHMGGPACAARAKTVPKTVEEAYGVQRRVLERVSSGGRPVAWKVSPPRPGHEPSASPVPTEVLRSPATLAARAHRALGVEAELAVRLAATPRPGGGVEGIRGVAGEMLVLIEWCETRISDWDHAPALLKLADFQSHGIFIAGSGTPDPPHDFHAQGVELEVGGRLVSGGIGTHTTCDLWSMLAWAVDHCARQGMPLEKGDIVTTGSWTGITPLAPGAHVVARFPAIGEARLTLT